MRYLFRTVIILVTTCMVISACGCSENTNGGSSIDGNDSDTVSTSDTCSSSDNHSDGDISSISDTGNDTGSGNGNGYTPAETNAVEFDGETAVLTRNGLTCTFDKTGALKKVSGNGNNLALDGIFIDVGVDGETLLDQVIYESFLDFNTWTLPNVNPKRTPVPVLTFHKISQEKDRVVAEFSLDDFLWEYIYTFEKPELLKISVRLKTTSAAKKHINGVTFIVKNMDIDYENTSYEFCGNSPYRVFNMANYPTLYVGKTDYSNPVVHFTTGDTHLNILYINEHEKWGTGVYRDKGGISVANTAATEAFLANGEALEVGNLYIQFPGDSPYEAVSDFYTSMGWAAPSDGKSDGPVYSGHPFGTMDSGFSNMKTLQEYSDYLDTINNMGYKNVWLLPVFDHPQSSVYASNNQRDIDIRYGGAEGLKVYTEKAHELGMRVLFDYVPHGPRPHMPLAKDNPGWCSVKMDGTQQIEWDCVSFDYNNPGFYEYMVDSVYYHAKELGVDGARIDCAMGGLSNWAPMPGLRPSSSGLMAGLNVTRAIREGFLKAGKAPVIFPENFHPVPYFAPYSDVFYDMTLYRTIYDLRTSDVDETRFAKELSRWLSVQRATAPKGQVYLRFLSNHDTVSWVWDEARPINVYGVQKAKALWSLLHFIDGIPMIYQGDENPSIYRGRGETLIDFFTGLNNAREQFLGHDFQTEYILNNTAIVAFRRFSQSEDRLVLVNLSADAQSIDITGYDEVLYNCSPVTISSGTATLSPYSAVILDAEKS